MGRTRWKSNIFYRCRIGTKVDTDIFYRSICPTSLDLASSLIYMYEIVGHWWCRGPHFYWTLTIFRLQNYSPQSNPCFISVSLGHQATHHFFQSMPHNFTFQIITTLRSHYFFHRILKGNLYSYYFITWILQMYTLRMCASSDYCHLIAWSF